MSVAMQMAACLKRTTTMSTASARMTCAVVFTNDLYDPVNGVDRNLRVDSITIDGVTYQTEHPTVYSTGTWQPEDGIVPGFRESEILHTSGYFQYAEILPNNGSVVEIRANGTEGPENMELRIDGTWFNRGQTSAPRPKPMHSRPTARSRPRRFKLVLPTMCGTRSMASITT